MANVNLKSLTTVLGENGGISDIPISATGIVTCGSNEVLKVNSLYVSNIDGANSASVTVDVYDGVAIDAYIVKNLSVAASGKANILENPIYINEGQSVRLTSSAAGDLSGFISYERIT